MKRLDQPQRNAKGTKNIFRSSSLRSLRSFAAKMICLLAARVDFGFGNSNLAGALFAMLAVGVWVFDGCKSLHPCKSKGVEGVV